jgi:HK97 family phage major capsid protein
MGEKKMTVSELLQQRRELISQREAVNIRMNEMEDKAKAEKREFTPEEKLTYGQQKAEFERLSREIQANREWTEFVSAQPKQQRTKNEVFREMLVEGKKREFILKREATVTTDTLESGGMIPLSIQDIIKPLEDGLIFGKVGIPVQTGVKGNIQWPVLGSVKASIQGENVKIDPTGIDMDKIVVKKGRIAVQAELTNQALNDSDSDLLALTIEQLKNGVERTINQVTFTHEQLTGPIQGPFAGAKAQGTFAGAVPTFKELIKMKGAVAATGVNMLGFCYVMSENMKAELESTPKDAGSGRMIIENGTIAGYPVFCTNFINYGADGSKADVEYIAAGAFAYLAANQYGDARLIVDPYTGAGSDKIIVTLNTEWSLTTLRSEAFALYKTKAA